jgi:hypothetical protein
MYSLCNQLSSSVLEAAAARERKIRHSSGSLYEDRGVHGCSLMDFGLWICVVAGGGETASLSHQNEEVLSRSAKLKQMLLILS